jgi:hypothetical protein
MIPQISCCVVQSTHQYGPNNDSTFESHFFFQEGKEALSEFNDARTRNTIMEPSGLKAPPRPDWLQTHTTPIQSGQDVKLTTRLHLVLRLRIR